MEMNRRSLLVGGLAGLGLAAAKKSAVARVLVAGSTNNNLTALQQKLAVATRGSESLVGSTGSRQATLNSPKGYAGDSVTVKSSAASAPPAGSGAKPKAGVTIKNSSGNILSVEQDLSAAADKGSAAGVNTRYTSQAAANLPGFVTNGKLQVLAQ